MKRGRIYVHVGELPTGFGTGAAFWFSTGSTSLFTVLLGQTTTNPTVSGTVASALEKEKCRRTWNINVPLVAKRETPFRGQFYAADSFTLWWVVPAHPRCGTPKTTFVLGDRCRRSLAPWGPITVPSSPGPLTRTPPNTGNW